MKFNIKRVFSLMLTVAVFISMFAISASAEEFDNTTGWLNLYDYNPTLNRNFTSKAGVTREYVLDVPARMRLFDIDLVMFVTNGAPDVSVRLPNGKTILLTKAVLSNNMVRYYGYIYNPNYDAVTLLIDDSVDHSGSFISAKACTVVSTSYNTIGSMRFQSLNPSKPIDQKVTMASSSKSAHIAVSGLDFNSYILELSCADWYKYDTLDFVVSLDGVSVDSISADHNGKGIDVEYELADTLYDSYLYLVLRLDLTGLPRDSTIIPKITITGQTEDAVGLSLVKVKGCLYYDVPNPYLHWLYEIHYLLTDQLGDSVTFLTSIDKTLSSLSTSLVSKLTSLTSTVSAMNNNLANKLTTLNSSVSTLNINLVNKLTTLNSSITSMNTDLGNKLTTINTSLTTKFDSLISTTKAQFTLLKGWLSSGFESVVDSVVTEFTSTRSFLTTQFNNLKSWLSSGFKSVTDKLDVLINGTKDQQDAADQYKEDSAQQSGQIDNAVDNMQVAKPDSGQINGSVDAMTGGMDFGLYNNALVGLANTPTLRQVMLIVVTLMTVAYLFFGKRV